MTKTIKIKGIYRIPTDNTVPRITRGATLGRKKGAQTNVPRIARRGTFKLFRRNIVNEVTHFYN